MYIDEHMHYHLCLFFSHIAFAPNTLCLCSKGGRFLPYTSHLQPCLADMYFQTFGIGLNTSSPGRALTKFF